MLEVSTGSHTYKTLKPEEIEKLCDWMAGE
jgi:hypothetical protein